MAKPFINLKIFNKKGEIVEMVTSHKPRKVWLLLQVNKFADCIFEVCVNYGEGFRNEGEYKTKKDLIFALKAFLEK